MARCGRALREGDAAFALGGIIICPECFVTPTDNSEYIEGPVPIDAICGHPLGPQPEIALEDAPDVVPLVLRTMEEPVPTIRASLPNAPSPLDEEPTPEEQYTAYVQAALALEALPLTLSDWIEKQTLLVPEPPSGAQLQEAMDESVRTLLSAMELAYALGQESARD